jgi:hypothetical protein
LKVIEGGENQEVFRPGEPFEVDVEGPADRAAAAVRADHIIGAKHFLAVWPFRRHRRAAGILTHIRDPGVEPHIRVDKSFEPFDTHAGELVLFGLDDEWIRGFIPQHFMIEFDDSGRWFCP